MCSADVYSMGMIFFALIAGRLPFTKQGVQLVRMGTARPEMAPWWHKDYTQLCGRTTWRIDRLPEKSSNAWNTSWKSLLLPQTSRWETKPATKSATRSFGCGKTSSGCPGTRCRQKSVVEAA
ncbi:unnamed protein product [Ectocarpus sp. 12 AP-2014]